MNAQVACHEKKKPITKGYLFMLVADSINKMSNKHSIKDIKI